MKTFINIPFIIKAVCPSLTTSKPVILFHNNHFSASQRHVTPRKYSWQGDFLKSQVILTQPLNNLKYSIVDVLVLYIVIYFSPWNLTYRPIVAWLK